MSKRHKGGAARGPRTADQAEPARPQMHEPFGARLRRARESRGVSLAHIATVTKISARALEAVERNDYSRLPGGIFMRSFVRAYASEVGLDPDAAVRDFLAECPDDVASIPSNSPAVIDGPSRERWHDRVPLGTIAILIAVLVAVVFGAYLLYKRTTAPPVEGAVAPSSGAALPGAAAPRAAAAAGAVGTAGLAQPLRIEIAADAPCWVSLAVDGRPPHAHIFRKGERASVRAEREVLLRAGDAAAVRLTLNGAAARPLGPAGQPVAARFTPDALDAYLPVR